MDATTDTDPTTPDPERTLRPTPEQAVAAWRSLVIANREQIERLREERREGDFWARRSQQFRPGLRPSPEFDYLAAMSTPEDTWLDIGAGGGRFAIPLAGRVREVVAVDPSPAMRETLAASADEAGLSNIRIVEGRWPEAAERVPEVDASLASHILYDIDDIGGFLAAMERRTGRLCVVVIGNRAPSTAPEPSWTELQGEPLNRLPALREFLAVLGALGRRFDVRTYAHPAPEPVPAAEAHAAARRLYWVAEGSEKDRRLGEILRHAFGVEGVEGGGDADLVALPPRIDFTATVSWEPHRG